jgi:hypothetical protein
MTDWCFFPDADHPADDDFVVDTLVLIILARR